MSSFNPDIDEEIAQKVKALAPFEEKLLGKTLGIRFDKISKETVAASLEVNPTVHQPFGILHGGVSVALAETVASVAAWLQVDETTHYVVGMEINANHLTAVRSGRIVATATPIKIGRTIQVWNVSIDHEDGRKVCHSRCTLMSVPLDQAPSQ